MLQGQSRGFSLAGNRITGTWLRTLNFGQSVVADYTIGTYRHGIILPFQSVQQSTTHTTSKKAGWQGTEKVINEWPTLAEKFGIRSCLFTLHRQKWDSSATNRSLRLLKQRSVCKEFYEAPYFIFCAWSAEPFHLLAAIDALSAHYSPCCNMVLSMWRYSLERLLIYCQMGRVLSNYWYSVPDFCSAQHQ